MQIKRRFTTAGKSPYEKIPFRRATSEIKNPDGSVVFKCENFAVPEHWSAVAADILPRLLIDRLAVKVLPGAHQLGLVGQVGVRKDRRHRHHIDLVDLLFRWQREGVSHDDPGDRRVLEPIGRRIGKHGVGGRDALKRWKAAVS